MSDVSKCHQLVDLLVPGDLLPLRPSAKDATRSRLIIYAPSDAQVIMYPVYRVKQPSMRERSVFIDKGNAVIGVVDTLPTFPARSRRLPPPALLFQKQVKSSRHASTSPAIVSEYPSLANDWPSAPRKRVRFADNEPRVPKKFHRRVLADVF